MQIYPLDSLQGRPQAVIGVMKLPVCCPKDIHTHKRRESPCNILHQSGLKPRLPVSVCFLTAGSRFGSPWCLARQRTASPDPRVCRETPHLVFIMNIGMNSKYPNMFCLNPSVLLLWEWCCHITCHFFSSPFTSCEFFPHNDLPFLETHQRKKQRVQSEGGVWGAEPCLVCGVTPGYPVWGPESAECTVCSHQWAHR